MFEIDFKRFELLMEFGGFVTSLIIIMSVAQNKSNIFQVKLHSIPKDEQF